MLRLRPHVVHANDWQTALAPVYLAVEYRNRPEFARTGSLLTIHNMAYQGVFWHWDMLLTGLDWRYFNLHQMEFYGKLNLLKTGLVFADWLTTVSPTYAKEIQTESLGCGLDGVLRQRSEQLTGIVNGVDYLVWNPAADPHLAAKYDASNWQSGKAACKASLQKELGLPGEPRVPLVAIYPKEGTLFSDNPLFVLDDAPWVSGAEADAAGEALIDEGPVEDVLRGNEESRLPFFDLVVGRGVPVSLRRDGSDLTVRRRVDRVQIIAELPSDEHILYKCVDPARVRIAKACRDLALRCVRETVAGDDAARRGETPLGRAILVKDARRSHGAEPVAPEFRERKVRIGSSYVKVVR